MAISILKQPKSIVWSRNPIVFEFSTDNRFISQGARYIGELDFLSDSFEADYSFTLKWENRDYVFVFKNVPNDSGLELPIKSSTQTLEEWKAEISNHLNSYFPLYDKYSVNYIDNKIQFKAREYNADLNMSLTNSSAGLSISLYAVQLGVNQKLRENFALFMEILLENESGDLESFTKSVIEVDSENSAIWDIQEYITAGILSNSDPKPDFDSMVILKEKISTRTFKLRFAEMYGYPQQMRALKDSDIKVAVLGGTTLEYQEAYDLPEFIKDENINKWISSSLNKTILSTQKDYACIINLNEAISDVKLSFKLYYADGMIKEKEAAVGLWDKNQKLHVPIGLKEISSLINEDIGLPTNFSVGLKKGGSLISNMINYTIDHRYLPYGQTLMFLNSLGCFESIYTYGRCELGYSIEKNEKAFEQKVNRKISEGSIKEIDIEIRNEIKLNSGYISKQEIIKFRDFILSKSKYILHDGYFQPVILDSNQIKETEDGNNLHSISFSLKFSNEQILFSK